MISKRHRKILLDVLALPTAPFSEECVRQFVFDSCLRYGLKVREDKAGNVLAHYRHPAARVARPVCLCGHLDHPGFRAGRTRADGTLQARWLGGVPPDYFHGAKVRFFSEGRWAFGQVRAITLRTLGLERPQPMVHTAEIEIRRPAGATVRPTAPGMWDFPDPRIVGKRVLARACDDLAGVAAILCSIETLARRKARTEAYFLFTRAEEVGFIGAIAACRRKTIPAKCLVIAVETSSVLPGVIMGGGPILRVGDRSSVFTPHLTAWCGRVAEALSCKDAKFTFQRKLMDGGSCESSAYCQLGYDATGICIALGNYHNCDRAKRRLAPEYVHLDDVANLIRWFAALTTARQALTPGDVRLGKRLGQLERRYARLLGNSV